MFLSFRRARLALAAVALACCLCAAPLAQAQVIFDNFGPGDTFDITTGWTETGPTSGQIRFSQGEGFTPSLSGNLSTVTIAIGNVLGNNDVHLFLSNGSAGTPGTILESWVVTDLPFFGGTYAPLVLNSTAHPFLSAGTQYFIFSNEPGNEWDAWNQNSIGGTGTHLVSQSGGAFTTRTDVQGAFRITVTSTVIPEPGSLAFLFGLGVTGSVFTWRSLRRRKQ